MAFSGKCSPHPMYSARDMLATYGLALIAKSYTSAYWWLLFGHFWQMVSAILWKIRILTRFTALHLMKQVLKISETKRIWSFFLTMWLPLVGLVNFIIFEGKRHHKLTQLFNVCSCNSYCLCSLIPLQHWKAMGKVLFCIAILIKGFESFVINGVLLLQSTYKTISEWYLANNLPVENSLNNFAVLYNSLINLTYSSFVGMNVLSC